MPLSPGVGLEQAEAKRGNGVLTVALPKSAQAPVSGRKIATKAA